MTAFTTVIRTRSGCGLPEGEDLSAAAWQSPAPVTVANVATELSERIDSVPAPKRRRALGLDLAIVALAAGLVVTAALVGWSLIDSGAHLYLFFPPLLAWWNPRVGPGTVPAVVIAVAVVAYGPQLTSRLRWRPLLLVAYATSLAWTCCLALVDGFHDGIARQLVDKNSYLHDLPLLNRLPGMDGILGMLRHFGDYILMNQPVHWTTHVAAHPPGAFLVFVVLDKIGLSGGGWAGMFVILVGSSACAAVAITLRALGGVDLARRALPFLVLFPGAIWVGVSGDGMFAAVLAWGVALLAVGAVGRGLRADVAAACGGLLLGYTLYLSYGLALGMLVPLVVVALTRRWRPPALTVLGGLVVVAAFTAAGFWWFTGYQDTKIIYAASVAQDRPYSYFVWADIAAFVFTIGPATLAGLRRLTAAPRRAPAVVGLLALAAVIAVTISDLSGLSKAEVERIWLPFAVWMVPACALLPRTQTRIWLAAQAVLALLVTHLLYTAW